MHSDRSKRSSLAADAVVVGALDDPAPPRAAKALGLAHADGGSCVATLETRADAQRRGRQPKAVVAALGNGFIPPTLASDRQRVLLARFLERSLQGRTQRRPLVYAPLDGASEFVRGINEAARAWLDGRFEVDPFAPLGADGSFASISPALLLAACAQRGEGLVLAASPYGELSLIELAPAAAA